MGGMSLLCVQIVSILKPFILHQESFSLRVPCSESTDSPRSDSFPKSLSVNFSDFFFLSRMNFPPYHFFIFWWNHLVGQVIIPVNYTFHLHWQFICILHFLAWSFFCHDFQLSNFFPLLMFPWIFSTVSNRFFIIVCGSRNILCVLNNCCQWALISRWLFCHTTVVIFSVVMSTSWSPIVLS